MPAFKKIMPVLRVADLAKSIDWYMQRLGFELCWRSANDGENAMLQAGESSLMLSTGAHLGATPAFSGTLYFETDGVRELFARIQNQIRNRLAPGNDGVRHDRVRHPRPGWVHAGLFAGRVS